MNVPPADGRRYKVLLPSQYAFAERPPNASVGVDGDAFVVLLVIEALLRVAVAAGLPVASALSRTIGLLPGLV